MASTFSKGLSPTSRPSMYIDQVPQDPLAEGPMKMETVDAVVRVYSVGVKPPAAEKEQKVEMLLNVRT